MKELILPVSMIVLCLIGLVVVMYLMKGKDKPKLRKEVNNNNDLTVQEFLNVKEIRDTFLYTLDGYLISYIKVNSISIDLLSDMEKKVLTRKLTDEFSEIDEPFIFMAVSRPVDITPLVNEYVEMMHSTDDPIRKELLRNEIKVISEFSLSGEVVQREFFYKIWEKNQEAAESNLRKRVEDMMNKLESAGLICEVLKRHSIIRLCNLVNNPAFAVIEDTNVDMSIPYLNNYESEAV
jgi:hypothetical protein